MAVRKVMMLCRKKKPKKNWLAEAPSLLVPLALPPMTD